MSGYCFAFLRKNGAPIGGNYEGHIGWGFALADGALYAGSTENPSGSPLVLPGQNNGWWASRFANVPAMLAEFARRHYDVVKAAAVHQPRPEQARKLADDTRTWGYTAIGNNCLDHTYKILDGYGEPGLPWPSTHPAPNEWFGVFNGEPRNL